MKSTKRCHFCDSKEIRISGIAIAWGVPGWFYYFCEECLGMTADQFWEQLFKEQDYAYPPIPIKKDPKPVLHKDLKRCHLCRSKEIKIEGIKITLSLASSGKMPHEVFDYNFCEECLEMTADKFWEYFFTADNREDHYSEYPPPKIEFSEFDYIKKEFDILPDQEGFVVDPMTGALIPRLFEPGTVIDDGGKKYTKFMTEYLGIPSEKKKKVQKKVLKRNIERRKMSDSMRYKIMRRDNFHCVLCGATGKESKLVIDHIIPIAKEGKTVESNLRTLCVNCNAGKGIKLDSESLC